MSKVILSLKQSLVEWANRNLWSDVMVDCVPIPVRAERRAAPRRVATFDEPMSYTTFYAQRIRGRL